MYPPSCLGRLASRRLAAARARSIVSTPALEQWKRDGFVILKDLFSPEQKEVIASRAREIQQWPIAAGKHMHYFEGAPDGGVMLCRTENYLDYHTELHELLGPSSRAAQAAAALLGEEDGCVLFKERINYKLPGGGGFAPHQDAPAWSGGDPTSDHAELPFMVRTLNLNVAVDEMNEANGCLYVVPGLHHGERYPQNPDGTLTDAFCQAHEWIPVELEPGDALFFSLHIPHYSPPNGTHGPRTAVYITYAGRSMASESDKQSYYAEYRRKMPPAGEQQHAMDYAEGHAVYSWATPMLARQPEASADGHIRRHSSA